MELTNDVRRQIIAFAKEFTGSNQIIFHKFANRAGYMLVIETRNIEGFVRFLEWFESEIERKDIEVIRSLPEEQSPFEDFEKRSLSFFNIVHKDFGVATEINDGRISNMKKDYENEGGNHCAI